MGDVACDQCEEPLVLSPPIGDVSEPSNQKSLYGSLKLDNQVGRKNMAGVPPVSVPSIAFGRRDQSAGTDTSIPVGQQSGSTLWGHVIDRFGRGTSSSSRKDSRFQSQPPPQDTYHPSSRVSNSWAARWSRGPTIPDIERPVGSNAYTERNPPSANTSSYVSQLNQFVNVHPVFKAASHTSPHFGTPSTQQKGTPPNGQHLASAEAFSRALLASQSQYQEPAGTGSARPSAPSLVPSPEVSLRMPAASANGVAGSSSAVPATNLVKPKRRVAYSTNLVQHQQPPLTLPAPGSPSLTASPNHNAGYEFNSNEEGEEFLSEEEPQGNLWLRKVIIKLGTAHPVAPEFSDALVVPSLQFGDRLLEAFFSLEFYRKRIKWRVVAMCAFGLMMVCFQLWMGFANASRLRRLAAEEEAAAAAAAAAADSKVLQAAATVFEEVEARSRQLSELLISAMVRKLWSNTTEVENVNELSFYTLACVDQAVVDGVCLALWASVGFVAYMEVRMEAVSIIVQLFRTTLLVFFAQGMYSPCAIKQGAVDIVMNNLAVASANTTVFNCLGLARARRACLITLAWVAGAIELCIVMSRAPSLDQDDFPQLSLFIIGFLMVPVFSCVFRYRAEVSERESLFYAVMLEYERAQNSELNSQMNDMRTLQGTDIEKALPEGVVPSQIVHVAVMELKQAEKTADLIQATLPSLFEAQELPHSGWEITPISKDTDGHSSYKRDSQRGNHHFFSKYGGTTPNYRKDSAHSGWTGYHPPRASNARYWEVVMDASSDVKAKILNALKLLSRSHDLYAAQPQDPYQGAMLFHALGHDGSYYSRAHHLSSTTSRLQSNKTTATSVAPAAPLSGLRRISSGSVVMQDALSQMQQLPFLSGLGEMARNVGQNWTFDMLKVGRLTKDHAMLTTAMLLASPVIDKLNWSFDINKFYHFIRVIETEYSPTDRVPYHNRTHAAIHAHTMSVLLTWFQHAEQSTPLESLAVLVASLCHDVGHPGRTNAYLVNANRRLAIIYNDISVLENLHASKTFETLQHKESRFLAGAENEDYRFFRKLVIDLILATDMKLHFELINSYKLRRGCGEFGPFDESNRVLTLKLLMKAADLSHGALDWPIHQQLSMHVNEEFWAQGDAEEKLGLPKSPLCDRAKAHEMSKQQVSFLEFIVQPLYSELAAVDPSGNVASTCESLIKANIAKWRVMAASQSTVPVERTSTNDGKPAPPQGPKGAATPVALVMDDSSSQLDRKESNRSITYNIDIKLEEAASPLSARTLSATSRLSASPTRVLSPRRAPSPDKASQT
eukprot:Blabericola_migrator_1__3991@NODE_220_length_11204_cov_64_408458_g187_i0_p1_GENE_NODE_220_length_11204_cov_64_408458_g187_i0NODE_220_length_11204_cov_64_408458_g187_i0_p1_ORF_typecomplete_len1291_score171_69PDEase_I/PF00233_19/1_7e74HD/PF01966_22/0_023BAF1_ABF1/PF04684_13/1_6e04BAF1_ABF1/PF04684_13/1_1_NODE_220_length_11204_cov_64_408458_g187_i033927264